MIKVEGLVTFALWVFCLVEAISTPGERMRNLPKVAWVVIVLLFPPDGRVTGQPATALRVPRRGGRGTNIEVRAAYSG